MAIDKNVMHEICERMAEAQGILDDYQATGERSANDIVDYLQKLLNELPLLSSMHEVGYFRPAKSHLLMQGMQRRITHRPLPPSRRKLFPDDH